MGTEARADTHGERHPSTRMDRIFKRLSHIGVLVAGFASLAVGVAFYRLHEHNAWGEILHVALPAMVLFMECYMLCVMTVESRERDAQVRDFRALHEIEIDARKRVLDDLNRFRISTSREHYRQELARTLRAAQSSVVFTGVTMAASDQDVNQAELLLVIEEKEVQDTSFSQRGLIGERPEALAGALELVFRTRTQIKFRILPIVTRLRFQVCDGTVSVLGVAEGEPTITQVRPTERAFTIESTLLGESLLERFNVMWEEAASKDIWSYFDEVIADIQGGTPADKSRLTRAGAIRLIGIGKLGIPESFLIEHSKRFSALPSGTVS